MRSSRELVVLGTASQAPTRTRNHNGYLLRWDADAILFDPGEGTQRQLLLAGESVARITHICLTHFHGDHVLGLPGVLHRMDLDRVGHPVHILYPATFAETLERLLTGSAFRPSVELVHHPRPVDARAELDTGAGFTITSVPLDHRVDAVGYRIDEPDGRTMLPDRLEALGIEGPAVGELASAGRLTLPDGRVVHVEDVSVHRPGQSVAVIMDTRRCAGADELAHRADLVLAESTFLSAESDLADVYCHLTAGQAGRMAAEAGARRLVLTHYSQRHPDEATFAAEARAAAPGVDVVAARDHDRIEVPGR